MSKRLLRTAVLVGAASATLIAGCSGGKTPGAARVSTTGTAPAAPLTSRQCGDISEANVDLLAAPGRDGTQKAADTLERYHPPTSVKQSIEHFVGAGGAHFDDPGYPQNYKVLDDWVKQVCPALGG